MPRVRKPAAKAHSDAQIMQFTGQQYGEQAAQIAAQRAVPAASPPAAAAPASPAPQPPPGPAPGSLGPLTGPTARPDEPLTAGAPFGPGPGPSLGQPAHGDDEDLAQLRALYMARPSPSLRDLIEFISSGGA